MQGEKHMTKLEEMWAALAAYQPQADAAGHGPSWARMCKEKTVEAAYCAAAAAVNADADATAAVADAAAVAATYAADAAAAKKWAQIAIDRITRVLVKPAPPVQPAPVQEPVGEIGWGGSVNWHKSIPEFGTDLYTTAPAAQRQWTGLTDEDVYLLANEHLHYQTEGYKVSGVYNLARAIETKLKEKNNG
jgi:sulfur relay (sulfurtransferase) complex TusBCD TusD component (DsrE family)